MNMNMDHTDHTVYQYDESNFAFSNAAWMIPSASGLISAFSSILIMSIIIRSSEESRFSSYHILMFFMSFWDAIASVAIALTTIPMPSDVYDFYPFKGKALGTVGTCEAQGFLIALGTSFALLTNCWLNIYYLCTIRYGISEERMKKRIIPFMLASTPILGSPAPLAKLMMNHFHPHPFMNFCTDCSYPIHMQDEVNNSTKSRKIGGILLLAVFCIMITPLVLVVVTIFQAESNRRGNRIEIRQRQRQRQRPSRLGLGGPQLSLRSDTHTHTQSHDHSQPEDEFKETRALLLQACMYIAAAVLTWVWFLIEIFPTRGERRDYIPGVMFLIASFIFRPLQGFFNATIFIYHKAYCLCQANRRLRLSHAIVQVITSPKIVPGMLISGIEMADNISNDTGRDHDPTLPLPSNNFIGQGFQFDSLIGSFGSSASRSNTSNNNSNNSDESNIDVESESDAEQHSVSPDSLSIQEDDASSSSARSVNSGSITSNGYSAGTSIGRLASVAEEGEEDIDNDDP